MTLRDLSMQVLGEVGTLKDLVTTDQSSSMELKMHRYLQMHLSRAMSFQQLSSFPLQPRKSKLSPAKPDVTFHIGPLSPYEFPWNSFTKGNAHHVVPSCANHSMTSPLSCSQVVCEKHTNSMHCNAGTLHWHLTQTFLRYVSSIACVQTKHAKYKHELLMAGSWVAAALHLQSTESYSPAHLSNLRHLPWPLSVTAC